MASNQLHRTVELAARDMADALSKGRNFKRDAAVKDFLTAALWAAAASAENISKNNAWTNAHIDDSWTRSAADEKESFPIPDNITPQQFFDISNLLGLGIESLEHSIPTRIKLEPELEPEIRKILGAPAGSASGSASAEKPEPSLSEILAPGKNKEPVPAPEKKEKLAISDDVPARRPSDASPANVIPRGKDEFDSRIEENPGLPGDPRVRK